MATATAVRVRPFSVDVPEEDLVELRRRVMATRWPDRETVPDQSQGVQLGRLQELARYCSTFTSSTSALPSERPAADHHPWLARLHPGAAEGHRAWAELMGRLGYERYVHQGGDWGALVADAMARQAPPGLLGIHVNMPATVPGDLVTAIESGQPAPAGLSDDERTAFETLSVFFLKNAAYGLIMQTRPQTVGYGLTDSPVGLAAWLLDHGVGYGQPAGAIQRVLEGKPAGDLT